MTDALAGIRVIDFTTTIAGPHCTRFIADLGAEVIKVEAPEGDLMRSRPPLRNGASALFAHLNAGKKSVVLDLKKPAAIAAVKRLVATADVVVENYRPGVMRRLGLDYETLKAIKPDLTIVARGHSDAEVKHLLEHGADAAVMAERELAHSFAEMVMATPPYRGARHLPPATT